MLYYLPIQKSLKILPNISSTSIFPTIIPKNNRENIKKELELFYRSFSERILKEKTLIESKKMNLEVEKIKSCINLS